VELPVLNNVVPDANKGGCSAGSCGSTDDQMDICLSISARRCSTIPVIPKRRITILRVCMWRWHRPATSSAITATENTTAPTSRAPAWFPSCITRFRR